MQAVIMKQAQNPRQNRGSICKIGAAEGIRTSGLPLRRRPLYPTELLRHTYILYTFFAAFSSTLLHFVKNRQNSPRFFVKAQTNI